MKPTEEDIKQALLHPEVLVRDAALAYFALSFSRDRGIWPVAVRALEQYGWGEAFGAVWLLQNLPQTDETLAWLVGLLEGQYRFSTEDVIRIGAMIAHADAELLGRQASRLTGCKRLRGETRQVILDKIRLHSIPTDVCWKELENLCERHKNDTDADRFDLGRASRLVEAISRDGDRHAERVLAVLSQKIESFESNPLLWLEIFAAELAGLIRLEAAAPLLVARLKDDHGDFMNERCTEALTRIGGEAAVEAIARDFHEAPSHFRPYASSALRHMRGEHVVATALELLAGEQDWDAQVKFIGTALANLDARGLRAARDLQVYDLPELRRGLIATAVLTGEDFPELEHLWEAEQEHQNNVRQQREWLSGLGASAKPVPDQPVLRPVKLQPKVGRNNQCPCGSGKKYKKCCMSKDEG